MPPIFHNVGGHCFYCLRFFGLLTKRIFKVQVMFAQGLIQVFGFVNGQGLNRVAFALPLCRVVCTPQEAAPPCRPCDVPGVYLPCQHSRHNAAHGVRLFESELGKLSPRHRPLVK